jgi:AcrR family transcriptional regulator
MTEIAAGRRCSGLAPSERAKLRRVSLLAAALELFGTGGYAPTTVKQLCDGAGLSERYFYESFSDRENCLASLYESLMESVRTVTVSAMPARRAERVRAADPRHLVDQVSRGEAG